ncbi:hypothetical protein EDD11_001353 [Mortierella claussenii]|nr:hypothetical protein EDD11_001353 [Mortierella claussenii]
MHALQDSLRKRNDHLKGKAHGTANDNDNRHNEAIVDEQTPLLLSHNPGGDGEVQPTAARTAGNTDSVEVDVGCGREQNSTSRESPLGLVVPSTGDRSRRWDKTYSCFVRVAGTILMFCLLAAALSPWVAQRVLDRAMVLEIQKIDIHDMDDTGFQIFLQSTIRLDPVHDGFLGLTAIFQQVFQPTVTMAPTTLTLSIPTVDASVYMAAFDVEQQQMELGETLQLDISTHVRVTNATLMAEFFGRTLQQPTVEVAIRGPVLTRLGPLWYMNLRINRALVMDGLQGIQDAELVSMALPGDHPSGGVIMSGVARMNNPSKVMSLRMGAITFGIYLPSMIHPKVELYKIAEVDATGLKLEAGKSNDIELSGRLFHLDDWSKTGLEQPAFGSGSEKQLLLGQLLSRFIQGKNSTIQVRAVSRDPNLPSWLSEVFKTIVLSMVFPGSPTRDFIRSLDMNQLEFRFLNDKRAALLSGRLSSVLQLPPNVTFPIKLLQMKPTVSLKAPESKQSMASLEISDFLPTVSRQIGNTLEVHLDLEETQLDVLPEQQQEFYQFLNSSFTQELIRLGITGDSRAMVETGLGTFELGPIPFDVVTSQQGLGGLISTPPLLKKLDVVDSTEKSLTIKATLVLWNPSNISAILGDLSFLWSYGGYVVGMASVSDVRLQAGNNTIECFGMMDPTIDCKRKHDPKCNPELAKNASRDFISKYISGDNTTTIDVLGYNDSTRIPLLQPMMSSFAINTHLPEIDQSFLISATMYLLSHSLVLELQNPLDTIITVLYINGTASYKEDPLGHILVDFEHDIASPKPILIPANDHQNETSGYVKTPRLPVMFDLSSGAYEALKKALGGSLEVDVICHIKAKVGNMLMWVDFVKDGVQANVRKGF